MAKGEIEVKKTATVLDEVDRLHQAISGRAYDLFCTAGSLFGHDLADWFTAERQLVSRPAVELREKDRQFDVLAAVPGVDPTNLEVRVTPEDLLIAAETTHEHTADAGTVHVCEFASGKLFRSIHFPEKIDPDTAKAEYKNGMLHVTVAAAKAATAQKVEIKAA